jgi:hypothetical protein
VRRLALLLAALAAGCVACGGHPTNTPAPTVPAKPKQHVAARPVHLVEHASGSLPAPLQDASAAAWNGRVLLLGGLTAADASTDAILGARPAGARPLGTLPSQGWRCRGSTSRTA